MDFYPFDDDYVRRLREGDRETSEHFYWYFRDLLLVKLRRKLRSAQMADLEDLSHDVLVRVLEKVKGGQPRDGTRLGPYVHAFCDNMIQEWLRKPRAMSNTIDEGTVDLLDERRPDRDYQIKDDQQLVRRVLSELPERDATLLLAVLAEEDKDEMCARFGVTPTHLRLLLFRARKRFEKSMRKTPRTPETFG